MSTDRETWLPKDVFHGYSDSLTGWESDGACDEVLWSAEESTGGGQAALGFGGGISLGWSILPDIEDSEKAVEELLQYIKVASANPKGGAPLASFKCPAQDVYDSPLWETLRL